MPEYYYGDQVRECEIGGTCRTHGEMRNAHKFIVGKPRCRSEDNIKMDLIGR
jgi:hypothetical protein